MRQDWNKQSGEVKCDWGNQKRRFNWPRLQKIRVIAHWKKRLFTVKFDCKIGISFESAILGFWPFQTIIKSDKPFLRFIRTARTPRYPPLWSLSCVSVRHMKSSYNILENSENSNKVEPTSVFSTACNKQHVRTFSATASPPLILIFSAKTASKLCVIESLDACCTLAFPRQYLQLAGGTTRKILSTLYNFALSKIVPFRESNKSGIKKWSKAQSSRRLFCNGVPVRSSLLSDLKESSVCQRWDIQFLILCASSKIKYFHLIRLKTRWSWTARL